MGKSDLVTSSTLSKAALFLVALVLFIILSSLPLKFSYFSPPCRSCAFQQGVVSNGVGIFGTRQREKEEEEEDDDDGDEGLVTRSEDVVWVKAQMAHLQLGDPGKAAQDWQRMRKGINPRSREQQLLDLRRYHGISHYDANENRTSLPCPGELLVEEHHSNYGEPWAGGRDIFEFLVKALKLKKNHRVLEVGCGTLRAGLHFIRFLAVGHFHCLEKDHLSITTALLYELPAQGLLYKKPLIVCSDDMNITGLDSGPPYDLIYSSAVFIHIPDPLVWLGLQRLAPRLAPKGRLFVSHNMKFCTRLPADECRSKLAQLGLVYVGKHVHDSILFNHYEIWHEFSPLPRTLQQ